MGSRKNECNQNLRKTSKCTDIQWLLLFIAFWIVLIVIAYFAVIYGNYLTIIKGYDSFGNICGVKDNKPYKNFTLSGTDTSKKPNLFYLGYGSESNVLTICVETCNNDYFYNVERIYKFYKNNKSSLCRYDFDYTLLESAIQRDVFNDFGPCPKMHVEKSIQLKHRCTPLDLMYEYSSGSYKRINFGASAEQVFFSYVYESWPYIAALGCFAFFVSGISLYIIRLQGKISPCFVGFLCFITSLVLCIEFHHIYIHLPMEIMDLVYKSRAEEPRILYTFMQDFQINRRLIYGVVVICLITTEALVVVLFLSRKYIPSSVIVLKEAVRCWFEMPELAYFSLIASIVFGVYYSFWSYVLLCSTAASEKQIVPFEVKKSDLEDIKNLHWRQFEKVIFVDIKEIQHSSWAHIFGFIWIAEFIFACDQFCLETAATQWYLKATPRSTISSIIWTLITQHLGSAARRSFLAMFKIPRLIIKFICQKLREAIECCSFFSGLKRHLESIESFIKVPIYDMYAFVAIEPTKHCRSRIPDTLIMEAKIEELNVIRCVIYCTLFSAKVTVVNLTCLTGVFLMKDQENLYLYMSPVVLSSVLAFCIAHLVFSVVEIPVASILLNILEVQQRINKNNKINGYERDLIKIMNQINQEDVGKDPSENAK